MFTCWFATAPTCRIQKCYNKSRDARRSVNETFPELGHFAWQEGYGGFTVSKSVVPEVKAYILGQKGHHKRQDFKTEFLELLRRYGIEFVEGEVFK